MPEPYNAELALDTIRNILLNDGRLKVRSHCYDQMERRTVDDLDIKKVLLETGKINSESEYDEKHQKYKYKVDGFDTEGDELSVLVNIIESDWMVVVITVYED